VYGGCLAFVFAEQWAGPLGHWEQASGFTLHCHEGGQILQVRAEALGDFAGGVELQDETAAALGSPGSIVVS
jgi:hypothetical protein